MREGGRGREGGRERAVEKREGGREREQGEREGGRGGERAGREGGEIRISSLGGVEIEKGWRDGEGREGERGGV